MHVCPPLKRYRRQSKQDDWSSQGDHILAEIKFPVFPEFSLCYFYAKTNNYLNE